MFTLEVAAIAVSAGLLGSLVGVGGGVIIVPSLTLLMGVDIRHAIAASIIAVVATSSGAASAYVRERISNIRLGMLLEVSTASGALCGALLAGVVSGRFLYLLFGCLLAWTAWNMARPRRGHAVGARPDALADRLHLHGSYYDSAQQREVAYRVTRTRLGFGLSWFAGAVSGLLGVGGGIFKVPVMNLLMGVPIKATTATSNFMIGVTAATGAAVYFVRGDVLPFVAAPVAVGVLVGARVGSRLLGRLKSHAVQYTFVAVMGISAVQMIWKGLK
jgi:hypothetical protein